MNLVNDNGCGWLNQLPKRLNVKKLNENLISDYLVIGAGYTGLSTARKPLLNVSEQNLLADDSGEPIQHPLINEIFSGKKGSSYFKPSN